MVWTLYQLTLGVHIFFAIMWVGGVMFVGWGVYPAVASLPYIQQKKVLAAVMKRSHPLFIVEGIAVILTGFLLGTVLSSLFSQLSAVITFFIVLSSVSLNISPFILLVQIVVSLYGLIQYKKAADYNYQLVMEKTHQSPRTITRNGNFGDEHHRWRSA